MNITFFRKHTASIITLFAVLLICGSCGDRGEKRIKIGFLVKRPEEIWFQNEWKGAQVCADKLGFELVKIGVTDGEKTLAAIDNLAAQGARGFVICTPDVRLGPAIMTKARAYGMKVVAVDDRLVDAEGRPMDVPYLGMDAAEIGRIVGKALHEELVKRGWNPDETAALAVSFNELETCLDRTGGAMEALVGAGFPAEKIFSAPVKTTDIPGGFDASDAVFTQHPTVKRWLLFGCNDEGVLGGVRALENRGFGAESVIGIGIGGSSTKSEFEKEVQTGFFATVFVNAAMHGFRTTEMVYRWAGDGVEPPKETATVGKILTKDTYGEALQELTLSQ
ncbi:arabinose ABC transporter substrate-binding protein [bacterium]|nr:arabinose ABC transporter substrate-binding protein [bacterium]